MAKARDQQAEKLSMVVLDTTSMLQPDSLDLTAQEEQEVKNSRCYGKKTQTKEGNIYSVLEPKQVLKDISEEQERITTMVQRWNRTRKNENYELHYSSNDFAALAAAERRRIAKFSDAMTATISLGLRQFENAMASKTLSPTIPPGWRDVAYTGRIEATTTAASYGMQNKTRKNCPSRSVDQKHPNAKAGTACTAFAHARGAERQDGTAFAHWRSFLMYLFSTGCKVAGSDVGLMLEVWMHAQEPCALPPAAQTLRPHTRARAHARTRPIFTTQVSRGFVFLPHVRTRLPCPLLRAVHSHCAHAWMMRRCGGPGTGKSMRAKVMKQLLAKGHVKPSGSSSKHGGENGGAHAQHGLFVLFGAY
jgi:hypothetical protein